MKAATHTEIYRPFEGSLRERPLRFWPIVVANVRTAWKRKLPLLLLYAPPAIATAIFGFIVYGKYAAESQLDVLAEGGGRRGALGGLGTMANMASVIAPQALKQLEVKLQIVRFHQVMVWFSLLATAWYGSGLFSEDRRVGAHQLYFSRPITRLDYFLGKLLTACFFSACALLAPSLVLCLVAAFSSPEWSFVTDQADVIFKTILYSSLWVLATSLAALCASSLCSKRIFSLVGLFALFFLSFGAAGILGSEIDEGLFALSPVIDIWTIGNHLFDVHENPLEAALGTAWAAVGGMIVAFLGVIAWRLRKLEVVA